LDVDIERLKQGGRDADRIRNIYLQGKFSVLNKLKIISPRSFYLWAMATKVIQ